MVAATVKKPRKPRGTKTTEAVTAIGYELHSVKQELTDVDREAALALLKDEIDLLPLGSTDHKATWVGMLTKHLLDPRRMPTPYRASVAGGVEVVASAAGLQVTAGERRGVIDWDSVHESFADEETA